MCSYPPTLRLTGPFIPPRAGLRRSSEACILSHRSAAYGHPFRHRFLLHRGCRVVLYYQTTWSYGLSTGFSSRGTPGTQRCYHADPHGQVQREPSTETREGPWNSERLSPFRAVGEEESWTVRSVYWCRRGCWRGAPCLRSATSPDLLPGLRVLRSQAATKAFLLSSTALVGGFTLAGVTQYSALLATWAVLFSSLNWLYHYFGSVE